MQKSITKNTARLPLVLLGAAELLVAVISVLGAGALTASPFEGFLSDFGPALLRAVVVAAVLMASLVSMGLYHFHQRLYFREILGRVAVSVGMATLVLAAAYFVIPYLALPRSTAIGAFAVTFTTLIAIRLYFFRHVDTNAFRRRTILFGSSASNDAVAGLRRRADRRGFVVVGTIDESEDRRPLVKVAQELGADEIVVGLSDRRGKLPLQELLDCVFHGVSVLELHEFLERESGKIRTDLISPSSLIFSAGFHTSRFQYLAKRLFDVIVGVLFLAVAWPFMLLVAAAIMIEDGPRSPALYRQERVGYKGELFSILKFRSMIENAESETGAVWASENDSRVTSVGKIIRKLRLDELPQLFNVIGGDMSFVGPRPERPEFVDDLNTKIPFYQERHMVKPGITGWAQLRYPYGSSDKDALRKLQYDLFYIKNQSITLDIVLMLQTLEVVLFGKGAR